MRTMPTLAAAALVAAFVAAPAQAAGNPDSGKKVFNQCRACHALEEGQHRVGPSLHGVFGRDAGAAPGFTRYSDAMKDSGIVWNEETMDQYLAAPRDYIPGNIMSYPGLKDPQKRADVIAYLKEATQ